MPAPSLRSASMPGIALACLVLGLAGSCGEALAGKRSSRGPVAIPQARAEPAAATPASAPVAQRNVAWTTGEPEARSCTRARRKLWQDGEGWVVKTVRSCL